MWCLEQKLITVLTSIILMVQFLLYNSLYVLPSDVSIVFVIVIL